MIPIDSGDARDRSTPPTPQQDGVAEQFPDSQTPTEEADKGSVSSEPGPTEAPATQDCPFCRETISAFDRKCGFCGYILDQTERAREASHQRKDLLGELPKKDSLRILDWGMYTLLALVCPLCFAEAFEEPGLSLIGVVIFLLCFTCWLLALSEKHMTRAQGYLLAFLVGFGTFLVAVIGFYAGAGT